MRPLSVDEVVGGFFSALDPEQVDDLAGTAFERDLRADLDALGPLREEVTVHVLAATAPRQGTSRANSSSSTGRRSP